MARRVWLVPVQPTPAQLKTTRIVLRRHHIPYFVVPPSRVRQHLRVRPPRSALLHGGGMTRTLIDAQRWLVDYEVTTLILVEGLTDDLEALVLDQGAYDVIALPVSARRLGSRLEAMGRSLKVPARHTRLPPLITAGDVLEIAPSQRRVTVAGTPIALTKSEYDLLLTLTLSHDEVVTRAKLAQVLGQEQVNPRSLESHISRIRSKLGLAGAPDLIESVRGVGYRLEVQD